MAYYDEAQKKWIWEDQPKGAPDPMAPGAAALPSYFQRRQQEEQQALLSQDEKARKEFQSKPARPLIAKDPGQFVSEFGKIVGNSATALATDTVDLGLGLVDVARAAAAPVTGDDFRWNQVFDDSDNPLTKWRRQTFRMETELGQAASNLVRIGTAFALFPKMAGRALLGGAVKGAAVAEDVGKVASKGRQIATSIGRLLEPMKPEAVTAALKTVRATELTSRAGKRAGRIAQGDEYLYATLRDYNRAARGALKVNDAGKAEVLAGTVDRWTALKVAAGKYTPNADKIKNFAQFAAWDAFVAFNVAGEGDYTMDETFGDMLEDSNNPYLRGIGRLTGTTAEMGALEVKGKQMLEGLVLGGIVESAFHYYRISRYVNAFQKATPTERAAIISAFEGEAENIGVGISKSMGETDNIFSRAVPVPKAKPGPGVMTPQQPTNAELKAQFFAGRSPTGQGLSSLGQRLLPPANGSTQEVAPVVSDGIKRTLRVWEGPQQPVRFNMGEEPERELRLREVPEGPVRFNMGEEPKRTLRVWEGPTKFNMGEDVERELTSLPDWEGEYKSAFAIDAYIAARQALKGLADTASGVQGLFDSVLGAAKNLIPKNRVSSIEVLQKIGVKLNDAGTQPVADAALTNFIQERGLKEGWIQLDPDTFTMSVRRDIASELDAGDAAVRQADALDAVAAALDEEAVVMRSASSPAAAPPEPVVPPSGPVQEALGQAETRNVPQVVGDQTPPGREVGGSLVPLGQAKQPQLPGAPEQAALPGAPERAALPGAPERMALPGAPERMALPGAPERMALPQGPLFTPGLVDEAMREAAQADALDAKAQQELARVLAGPKDQLSDEEAVRVAFGSGIDRLYVAPVVEKLADRPGFGVYGPDGELLKTFTSQRGADAYVKKVVDSERQGFVDRARAMNAQAQPVELAMKYGSPYLDSDVVGKVKITSGQARALQALFMSEAAKPVIDRVVGAVWTPGMFRGIDDLMTMEKGSRMIEMSQSQMSQIVEAVTKAAASGEITTSQRTALNNMVQRLQETAELLEPEAIAKRDVQNILDAIATLSKTGEFCGVV